MKGSPAARDQSKNWIWRTVLAAAVASLALSLVILPAERTDTQYIFTEQPPPCAKSFEAIKIKRAPAEIVVRGGSTQRYTVVVGGEARGPASAAFSSESSFCLLKARVVFPTAGAEVSPTEWQDAVLLRDQEVQWEWVITGLGDGTYDGLALSVGLDRDCS